MVETKLNQNNPHHQLLIAIMSTFVTDYGYHPRQLLELLDDSKSKLFFSLLELHKEENG